MAANDPFLDYLDTIEKATNETQKREAFVSLAANAFADTSLAKNLALGAEYKVNFEQAGVVRRGRIDCYYGSLVIEFENDLAVTGKHALDQLCGYVAGAWTEDGNASRPYLAVATDGRCWKVLTPFLADPLAGISAENVRLELNEELTASKDEPEALALFLNRLFFRKQLLRPTASNFTQDFGLDSPTFKRASGQLRAKLDELSDDPQRDVLQSEWDESLGVAYGGSVGDDELFVRHTYLASLARLLVFAALERRGVMETEVVHVLDGDYFRGRQIANIAEADFFSWHQIPSNIDASRVWVAVSNQLAGYDLAQISEDILKPLYETLVDPEFRHDLGEYYTPDWLAQRVVERLLTDWDYTARTPSVVDPACGSGTFLRACIAEIRVSSPKSGPELLADIVQSVVGVDVHPLAVIIARATYLLAVADLVAGAANAVTLPVFLSNSLDDTEMYEVQTLWGENELHLEVGRAPLRKTFPVPISFVRAIPAYDGAIDDVVAIAEAYAVTDEKPTKARAALKARLGSRLDAWPGVADQLASMSAHLVTLIRERRDTVWGFILRNRHRPTMLRGTFDFVVGNPPWLTIGDINNTEYKEHVKAIAAATGIAPRAAGEQAHTELATLFLPQSFRVFIRHDDKGKHASLAFVMPRSVMNASHHRLLREGLYKGAFRVTELWDLQDVHPLFNVPSCVLFCSKGFPTPTRTINYRKFAATLPSTDASPAEVAAKLRQADGKAGLLRLAKRSAWGEVDPNTVSVPDDGLMVPSSAYLNAFRQGAILYPQVLLVVESATGDPISRSVHTVRVRTAEAAKATAKLLKNVGVDHLIETESCFATLVAEHIAPFTLVGQPWSVVLPTLVDPDDPSFGPVSPAELLAAGRVRTSTWLAWAEAQWITARKESEKASLWERLDYLRQFSSQAGRARFVVLFTSSGSRAFATALDADSLDLPFVARDKTYWAAFSTEDEALFVTAFLNSDAVLERVEHFMTRGLLGARDTHKRVLDVPFPVYDSSNSEHRELVAFSRSLSATASAVAAGLPPSLKVGQARQRVRAAFDPAIWAKSDKLVAKLSSAAEAGATRIRRK